MSTIFEDVSGYVVRTSGGAATKALLRVADLDSWDVIFVTAFQTQKGVNNSVAYSLDNHIFLSVAGDRLGSLRLQGMAFGQACGDFTGVNRSSWYRHGGLVRLTEFYRQNRIFSGSPTVPKIEVFYTGDQSAVKHTGYVSGLSVNTSDIANSVLDFSLDCLLVP